ncbi:MAG: L-threonylcarbamoyladenylate synthase [Bacteroidales bacterium]
MKEEISKALQVLKDGGVIIYPTDTIWGIGCDATNAEAVARVFAMKKRTDTKSMLVLIHSESMLPSYVDEVPEIAWELIDAAIDPLTIIYPGAKNLARNLINNDQTIGIRVPDDPFCTGLISRFRKPIVSTSANISGSPAPAHFSDIDESLLAMADHVVNWRQEEMGESVPSSIIKLGVGGEIEIIRK